MSASNFAAVPLAPRDPILGLTEAFIADERPDKVNLGVGVYYDDSGKVPVLAAVAEAERRRVASSPARSYLPIEGFAQYNKAVQELQFGAGAPLLAAGRVATFESLGGTGALRVGADFLRRVTGRSRALISDPSWENHRAIFEAAGFEVATYPYYDPQTHGLRFEAMLEAIESASPTDVIVLHACCHNPTGVDLDAAQWARVVEACGRSGAIPFLDMAYQGFGEGIERDAVALRLFADAGQNLLVASSFSKNFSLYGERVGALSIVTADADETSRVTSQVKRLIRSNYSNPPTHGAALVAAVLTTPALRTQWEAELTGMRDRIRAMRNGLVEGLAAKGVARDFSFVKRQRGMFSFSGLSREQVDRLREEFGIYAVGSGRICLAALNSRNLQRVVDAIAAVV